MMPVFCQWCLRRASGETPWWWLRDVVTKLPPHTSLFELKLRGTNSTEEEMLVRLLGMERFKSARIGRPRPLQRWRWEGVSNVVSLMCLVYYLGICCQNYIPQQPNGTAECVRGESETSEGSCELPWSCYVGMLTFLFWRSGTAGAVEWSKSVAVNCTRGTRSCVSRLKDARNITLNKKKHYSRRTCLGDGREPAATSTKLLLRAWLMISLFKVGKLTSYN